MYIMYTFVFGGVLWGVMVVYGGIVTAVVKIVKMLCLGDVCR